MSTVLGGKVLIRVMGKNTDALSMVPTVKPVRPVKAPCTALKAKLVQRLLSLELGGDDLHRIESSE